MNISDFSYGALNNVISFGSGCYSYLSHLNPSTKSLSVFVVEPILGFLNGYGQAKLSFNKRYGSREADKINVLDNSLFTGGALPNIIAEGFKADIRTSNAIGLITYWAGGVANPEYRTTFVADSLTAMLSPSVFKRKIDTTILPYFYPPFSTYTQSENSNPHAFDKIALQMRNTFNHCFGPVHQSPDIISRVKTIETEEGSWLIKFDSDSNELSIGLDPKTIFSHPLDYFPFSLINYIYPRDYKLKKPKDLEKILKDFQTCFQESPFYRVLISDEKTKETLNKLKLNKFIEPNVTVTVKKDSESQYIIHSFKSQQSEKIQFVKEKKKLSFLESIFRKIFRAKNPINFKIPANTSPTPKIHGLEYVKEYSELQKKPILYLTIPDNFQISAYENCVDEITNYLKAEKIYDIKIGHKFTKYSDKNQSAQSISETIHLLDSISDKLQQQDEQSKLTIHYNLFNPVIKLSEEQLASLNHAGSKSNLNIYTMGYQNPNRTEHKDLDKDANRITTIIHEKNRKHFNMYHINIDRPKYPSLDKIRNSISLYLWAEIEKMFIVKFIFNINLQDITLSEKILRFLTTPLEILNTFLSITLFKPAVAIGGMIYLRTIGAEQTLFEGVSEGLKTPSFDISYDVFEHAGSAPLIFSNQIPSTLEVTPRDEYTRKSSLSL